MWRRAKFRLVCFCLLAAPAHAHDVVGGPVVVIDTDMGLDDAVTLALALQCPQINIGAIVACEGVAGREQAVTHVERMVELFNRRDIPVYAAPAEESDKPVPPFRSFAVGAVGAALPPPVPPFHQPFAPTAYLVEGHQTTVLVLGPLTNLAAALHANPDLRKHIAAVIVAGGPDPAESWNAAYDRAALAAVLDSDLPLKFVAPGPAGHKPVAWRQGELHLGRGTSIAESFFERLLSATRVREHYLERFASFHDELAFLYVVDATPFAPTAAAAVLAPRDNQRLLELFTRCLVDGRQQKRRVVFADGPLPEQILRADVRQRQAAIIAKNGETEWFAQLLMNELHEHLGAYSVIGVKMGLRAAELLNAPQHAMQVTAFTPAGPPVSCINDGIIVATGCTPGRVLFTHVPGPPDTLRVRFTYNGRELTLTLKQEYRQKIRNEITRLLKHHTLADAAYWDGVRLFGLEIWENWHRQDLFAVVETPQPDSP
ncbi:MAG: nucleoside hydrolase [Planctomycetes bacterium]|nr:nucleoside hydrolase [Planctomycetota bacterium]